jgi:hypothetical protein
MCDSKITMSDGAEKLPVVIKTLFMTYVTENWEPISSIRI